MIPDNYIQFVVKYPDGTEISGDDATPFSENITLTVSPEKNDIAYRIEYNDPLTYRGLLYDQLKNETSFIAVYNIKLLSATGVVMAENTFTKTDCEFNETQMWVKIKPRAVDRLTVFLDKYDDEFDWYDINETPPSATMQLVSPNGLVFKETIFRFPSTVATPPTSESMAWLNSIINPPAGGNQSNLDAIGWPIGSTDRDPTFRLVKYTTRVYTASGGDLPPAGNTWAETTCEWARLETTSAPPASDGVWNQRGAIWAREPVVIGDVSVATSGVRLPILGGTAENGNVEPWGISGFRSFGALLNAAAKHVGLAGVRSVFFDINNPNDAPSIDVYTYAAAYFSDLVCAQLSDFTRPRADVRASKMILSWKTLLDDLRILFNAEWDVERVGNDDWLRIEHVSFWETSANGYDHTAKPEQMFHREYSFNAVDVPRTETWQSRLADDVTAFRSEWEPRSIQYSPDVSVAELVNIYTPRYIVTQTDAAFAADIESPPDKLLKGMFLAQSTDDGLSTMRPRYSPTQSVESPNDPDGIGRWNAALSYRYLVREMQSYRRPFPVGELNGVETNFMSWQRFMEQSPFRVRMTHADFIACDWTNLQRSALGWGKVRGAKYDVARQSLELELNHA